MSSGLQTLESFCVLGREGALPWLCPAGILGRAAAPPVSFSQADQRYWNCPCWPWGSSPELYRSSWGALEARWEIGKRRNSLDLSLWRSGREGRTCHEFVFVGLSSALPGVPLLSPRCHLLSPPPAGTRTEPPRGDNSGGFGQIPLPNCEIPHFWEQDLSRGSQPPLGR